MMFFPMFVLCSLLLAQQLCTLPVAMAASIRSGDADALPGAHVLAMRAWDGDTWDGDMASSYNRLIQKHPVYNRRFVTRFAKFVTGPSKAEAVADAVAERVYDLTAAGKPLPTGLSRAWRELNARLRAQHADNAAAVVSLRGADGAHKRWALCAVLRTWEQPHKAFRDAFQRSPRFFRSCAAYHLVTGSSMPREAVAFGAHTSSKAVAELAAPARTSVFLPGVVSRSCTDSNNICFNLFNDIDWEKRIQDCLANMEMSLNCKTFCCGYVYYSSEVCDLSKGYCVLPDAAV